MQPGDSASSVVLTWSSPTYSLSPITYYIVACVPNATDSTATAPASRAFLRMKRGEDKTIVHALLSTPLTGPPPPPLQVSFPSPLAS